MSLLSNVKVLYRGSLIAVLVCFTNVTQGAKYSCQAPISVSEGSTANISCYFSEDVQVTKKNVKIHKIAGQFYPDAVVAECFWSDAQSFRCDQQGGYKLQGEITNRATLAIPWATKAFEGKYMCELVPSEPSDIEPCEFRLEETSDAININLSTPDIRSLIIAAIAISVLSMVIVVLSIFLRNSMISCLGKLKSSSKNSCCKKFDASDEKGGENVPLTDMEDKGEISSPQTTISDKRFVSGDNRLASLNVMVENSVRDALFDVAQTDTGAMVISTMTEIQRRRWDIGKAPTSNEKSHHSKSGAAITADKPTISDDILRDNMSRRSGQVGAKPNEYVIMENQGRTSGTSADQGTFEQGSKPVPSTQAGVVTSAQFREEGSDVIQNPKSKKLPKKESQKKVKGESADKKHEGTSEKETKTFFSVGRSKSAKTPKKNPKTSKTSDV